MDRILFVCSGNTCRSPMAEGIFNARATALGLNARASSCGTAAFNGMPVTPKAVTAAAARGADISAHTAQSATEKLLEDCTVALCMTAGHAMALKSAFPEHVDKIRLLARRDIPDPFGGSQEDYERAADAIAAAVDELCAALRDEK